MMELLTPVLLVFVIAASLFVAYRISINRKKADDIARRNIRPVVGATYIEDEDGVRQSPQDNLDEKIEALLKQNKR